MTTTSDTVGADRSNVARVVLAVLVLWLALAILVGYSGVVRPVPGEPPLILFIAVVGPIALFLAAYAASKPFKDFVLSRDLRAVTMVQAWRVLGGLFLALYAFDLLPGLFAFPAGLGDVAVGLSAPFVALALIDRPDFARGRAFVVWNLLGLLDFVVAVGTGTLASGAFADVIAVTVTTAPMNALPLFLIPGFLVPLFTMLHLTALFQARRLKQT